MANTFNLGNGNWAQKTEKLLAYNAENDNYKPLPFDFDRASTATVVNKDGLIETVGVDEPRIDFTDNTKGHLLLEPSRQNKITHSEQFDINSSWLSSGRPDVDTNVVVSPDGSQNGSKLTFNSGDALRAYNQFTFTNGYSYSIFVKKDVGRYVTIFAAFFTTTAIVGFDLDEGTCQSGGVIEDYGNGWYRISVSKNVAGDADKSGYFYLYSTDTLGSTASADGNKLYVYGAQVEEGSYATSYIPTSGSAVTRSADVCNSAGNSTVFNDSEGVLYAEVEFVDDAISKLISINDNSSSNRILFGNFSDGNFKVYSQSSDLIVVSGLTGNNKIAAKYKSGDFSLFVNGVEIGTSTSTILPTGLSELSFDNGSGGSIFYGKVKDLKVYNTALSDSELQALTSN